MIYEYKVCADEELFQLHYDLKYQIEEGEGILNSGIDDSMYEYRDKIDRKKEKLHLVDSELEDRDLLKFL